MKLTHLQYFQTVCKHSNLTRAAEELHISQPGLTHVIHDLERGRWTFPACWPSSSAF